MRSLAALLALIVLSLPCYAQSQSELRKLRKQWQKQQKEKIRDSGYDENKSGRLSATERKKLLNDLKQQIRDAEKKRGKK